MRGKKPGFFPNNTPSYSWEEKARNFHVFIPLPLQKHAGNKLIIRGAFWNASKAAKQVHGNPVKLFRRQNRHQ